MVNRRWFVLCFFWFLCLKLFVLWLIQGTSNAVEKLPLKKCEMVPKDSSSLHRHSSSRQTLWQFGKKEKYYWTNMTLILASVNWIFLAETRQSLPLGTRVTRSSKTSSMFLVTSRFVCSVSEFKIVTLQCQCAVFHIRYQVQNGLLNSLTEGYNCPRWRK